MKIRYTLKAVIAFTIMMMMLLLTACSATSEYNCKSDMETISENSVIQPNNQPNNNMYGDDVGISVPYPDTDVVDTRKIIKTVSLELETKTFGQAVKDISIAASDMGGYIENSYVSGQSINNSTNNERYANFTIRVPEEKLDIYVENLSLTYNVLSTNSNSNDITDVYYDTAAHLKSLITQEERLLSMLEQADELEYMLKLEESLANVRYQIESYNSAIQRYDSQVSLSTLTISLKEVVEYKIITEEPKTFGERFVVAFKDSWQNFADGFNNFVIAFIYALPTILVFSIIIAVITLMAVNVLKKRRAKREKEKEKEKE